MRTFILALSTILFASVCLAEITKDNGVLVLDDSNFDEALATYDQLLVEFYAPWCGHCKQLAPNYEAAAQELEPKGLYIAKVDATVAEGLAKKYSVSGFPTLKFFNSGTPIDYNGGRTKEDIVNYVVKKTGPAAKSLDSAKAVDEFTAETDVAIVGFFDSADSAEAKIFMQAANMDDNLPYAIAIKAGGKAGTFAVIKKFDDKRNEMTIKSGTEASELISFAQIHSLPLVSTFSPETSRGIFGGPVQVHVLYFNDAMEGAHKEAMEGAALTNRGKTIHVFVPKSETRVVEWFGLKDEDLPTIMLADMRKDTKKYSFGKKEITQKALEAFEADFLAGKLAPTLKSAEPSDADVANPVKVITGKSFEPLVLKSNKDVLVEFYAPWCGHCKALAPKYDQLAETLEAAGVKGIMIAKMDATENEIDAPGVEVQGFPTLYFFKNGSKDKPMQFEGEREVEGMLKFLHENASEKFEMPEVAEPAVEAPDTGAEEL